MIENLIWFAIAIGALGLGFGILGAVADYFE